MDKLSAVLRVSIYRHRDDEIKFKLVIASDNYFPIFFSKHDSPSFPRMTIPFSLYHSTLSLACVSQTPQAR